MSQNDESAKAEGRRTQVKDLPQPEKELTPDEQKQVKGGIYKVVVNDGPAPQGGQGGDEANFVHHSSIIAE